MSDAVLQVLIVIWVLSLIGIFVFVFYALYLRKKWLSEVEILFRGYDLMSEHLYFSILACIQYGGAFTSLFLAKRSKMLEAREKVPYEIQKKFIFSFWLFMVSGVLLFSISFFLGKA